MPELAPLQLAVEHGTFIMAWHQGPFKLVTNIASVAGRGEEILLLATAINSIETVALRAFIPANLESVGGFFWISSLILSAEILTTLMSAVVNDKGRLYDRYVDRCNERKAMFNRLDLIEESIAVEVLPKEQGATVSKTYVFGAGRLAKQGARIFMGNYFSNPLKIFVTGRDDQVLEIAEMPGLGWV